MTTIQLQAEIPAPLAGQRLDAALSKLFSQYSRARLQHWIKAGFVTVNGQIYRQRDKVQAGQEVVINATLKESDHWQAQADITLNIVFEDEDILVINKPAGLVVHPGAGNLENTLVNALLHHDPALKKVPRAGIVHRLDKDTSGLLIVAKNLAAHKALVTQIQNRTVKREYLAVVNGIIISGGTIDAPIARHPVHRTKMAVVDQGRNAVSHYRVVERFRAHSLVKVQLETGRTHQIRVHMAHIHHSLIGDPNYAGRMKLAAGISEQLRNEIKQFKRQALHAFRLEIVHPKTQQVLSWEAPLPADMMLLLEQLRIDAKKMHRE